MPKKKPAIETRLKGVMEQMLAKLPPNVSVDVTKLAQMGLGGVAGYTFAEPMMKQAAVLYAHAYELGKPPAMGGFGGAFGILGMLVESLLGGAGITEEEQKQIAEFKMTEEEKFAFACAVAALTPMLPDMVKGLGSVIEGVIPG